MLKYYQKKKKKESLLALNKPKLGLDTKKIGNFVMVTKTTPIFRNFSYDKIDWKKLILRDISANYKYN